MWVADSPATEQYGEYDEYDEPPYYAVRWLRPHYATALLNLPTAPVAQGSGHHWHAFTEAESEECEDAWLSLPEEARLNSGETYDGPAADEMEEDEEDVVGVAIYKDKLYEVDVRRMQLKPVYWRRTGKPIPVMRANWMYDQSRPVPEPLNGQLEEAYLRRRPWLQSYVDELDAALKDGGEGYARFRLELPGNKHKQSVFFPDADSARVISDHLGSRFSKSLYSSFSSSSANTPFPHATLVYRGYDAAAKAKPPSRRPSFSLSRRASASQLASPPASPPRITVSRAPSRRSSLSQLRAPTSPTAPRLSRQPSMDPLNNIEEHPPQSFADFPRKVDEQLRANSTPREFAKPIDEHGKASSTSSDEVELVHTDLPSKTGEEDDGEITDLVFMIHGIGQKATAQFEGLHWVYATNLFRQIVRKQSATPAISSIMKGHRVQFLPIEWRSTCAKLMDEDHRREQVTASANRYTLADITLKENVAFARELFNNVILDLPLFMSRHREYMMQAVCMEANAAYRKWCARHPGFDKIGRVHIVAHSIGSVLASHVLSAQPTHVVPLSERPPPERRPTKELLFNTSALFMAGSPLAMFMSLDQSTLIARRGRERTKYPRPDESLDKAGVLGCLAVDSIYNVFYQADIIAYRLNPVVDSKRAFEMPPSAIESINASLLARISRAVWALPSYLTLPSMPHFAMPFSRHPAQVGDKATRDAEAERARGRRRFAALNPHGTLDFYLPSDGLSEYLDMVTAHMSYWSDATLASFILAEIFAEQD
ncbi:hypothetical protein AURDEDRAFT_181761 [Auricularia subglabra TFB-10046 SS5]|nr:hypothetical protein AURDEDRAFT_181761 [Auricularia subglabra TFB-10046 SS5]